MTFGKSHPKSSKKSTDKAYLYRAQCNKKSLTPFFLWCLWQPLLQLGSFPPSDAKCTHFRLGLATVALHVHFLHSPSLSQAPPPNEACSGSMYQLSRLYPGAISQYSLPDVAAKKMQQFIRSICTMEPWRMTPE